jgi:hypothetical protein
MINTLHHFLVQHYPAVTAMVPEAGVSVLLTGTPNYGANYIQVFGNGILTIAQLYAQYLTAHTGSGDLQTQINSEIAQRIAGDNTLQNNINAEATARVNAVNAEATLRTNAVNAEATARAAADAVLQTQINSVRDIAEGARIGIVFDSTAQLNAWIAGSYARPDGIRPIDMKIGESIYIIAQNEPDYWWAKNAPPYYYEQEAKTDLRAYRKAADQDVIDTAVSNRITAETTARTNADTAEATARANADNAEADARVALEQLLQTEIANEVSDLLLALALKANINSPHLTGIPETPTPDYRNPMQILNVSAYEQLRDLMTALAPLDYMIYGDGDGDGDVMLYGDGDVMAY